MDIITSAVFGESWNALDDYEGRQMMIAYSR